MPTESETPATKLPAKARPVRRNEWTRGKMVTFLRELAATQSVSHAARAVGMSRASAYALRNRLKKTPFDLGWEVALEMGFGQLAQAVMDRALNGVEEQRFYHGELVGTVRRFDNRLAQWVLANPWRVGRNQMAREYTSDAFERLLERIESAGLAWEPEEPVPGREVDLFADRDAAEEAEARFARSESWYAAQAEEEMKRGSRG
ncbi:hypothetical protein [Altererythrobacter lauratis]|uniref:LysR family transcriptional regulator n=1 Tax=Alteraurantiacibacter lauratis TaxID=2054627 RepID=A0ABV7EHK6_9SPHN